MNNKCGMQIKRLILSNGSDSREVELFEGLNVISGPTDTGKTYIFQCIRYVLGSNDAPKTIPENKEYLDVYLELYSYSKKSPITLRRIFSTSKVHIYSCIFENINEKTDYITVNTSGRINLISSKMLEYLGFNSIIELKTHVKENKFRKLTLRDFLHFSFIDEKEVIKDKSVLTTGQYISRTIELNAFFYFLTGKYTDFLSYLSKLKSTKNKIKGKGHNEKTDNYLEELITATRSEIYSLNLSDAAVVVSYKNEMLFVTSEIEEQSDLLKGSFESTEKLKSKRLVNQELIKRFSLLKDHFKSDLKRLDFILEGGHILSNLGSENCPTCGKNLNDFHGEEHLVDKDIEDIDINYEKLFASYNSEKEKILLNLNDLSVTLDSIEEDNTNINNQIYFEENRYANIKRKIENELKPTEESLHEKISKEVDERLIRAKHEFLTNQLNKLSLQKEHSQVPAGQINSQEELTVEAKELVDVNIEILTKLMNTYLLDMKFPDLVQGINNVSFSIKDYDFIVNGKARSVYGKGFRSIIYSVFIISLMVYCQKNNLPHMGFVLIDSPLTTYQESLEVNTEEKIPEELKERFINTFTKIKESQVIILENKFTLKLNDKNINFIEFTKDRNNGRYGFM